MSEKCYFPLDLNMHHIKEEEKYFFLDGDTGLVSEESKLTYDILNLAIDHDEESIYSILSATYSKEAIKQEIDDIIDAVDKKLIADKENILYDEASVTKEQWENSQVLENLWLNVSNDCNMRCIYCFEDGGHYGKARKIMSKETLKKSIDFWYKYLNKNAKNVFVIFFGGEPLYNIDGVKFAVNYVQELLKPHDITPNFNITTNGTLLTEDTIKFLVEKKIPVTISIDGGKVIQDKNRPFANGKGSFDVLSSNLKKFFEVRKYVTARVTLVHDDVKELCNIVKDLWDLGFAQVQYDLVSTDNPKLRITDEDLEIVKKEIVKLTDLTYESICHDQWRVLRNLTKAIQCVNFPNRDLMGCSLYAPFTVMVDPEGAIFKCQRLMDDKYKVGDIENGVDWNKFYTKRIQNKDCSKCWAAPICNEGCPQVKLVNCGNVNSNYYLWCEHNKFLIGQALRLYVKFYSYNPEIFKELREFQN